MRCLHLAALAAAVAGCTGSGDTGPNPISLTVVGSPAMLAYRNAGGAWVEPTADDQTGDYTLHVGDVYTVALTCSDTTGFDTVVQSRTADDGDALFVYCDGHATALPGSASVTGQMLQAGTVSMYDFQQGLTAPWTFTLAVPPGTRDLVAIDNGKALIERDLAVADGLQLEPIDVERAGTPLAPVPLALDGVMPQENVTTEVDLYSANNLAFGPTVEGTTAQVLPDSLLLASDELDLYLTSTTVDGRFTRTVDTWFDGSQTRFQLMPTLDGVTITGATATWGELPSHTIVALDLVASTPTTYSAERISASQAWLDATGTTELALPADMPRRFQPSWTVDPSTAHDASFTARDDSTDIAYESSVNEVSSAPRVAGSYRAHLRSLRRSVDR